jgi:signal transduction histidine kinase
MKKSTVTQKLFSEHEERELDPGHGIVRTRVSRLWDSRIDGYEDELLFEGLQPWRSVPCPAPLEKIFAHRRRERAGGRRQRTRFQFPQKVIAALTHTLVYDELLDLMLESVASVIPHDGVQILLIKGDTAQIVRSRGGPELEEIDSLQSQNLPVAASGDVSQVLERGRSLVIGDVRIHTAWEVSPRKRWIRAFLGSPIRLDGQVIGVIRLFAAEPGVFSPDQARWLERFANQAAVALKNAREYSALQRQVAELEVHNLDMQTFIHAIAHDLRSPLQVMNGYLELFFDVDGERISSQGSEMLEKVRRHNRKTQQIIKSLYALVKTRNECLPVAAVEVTKVVRAAVDRVVEEVEAKGVVVEIADELPPVIADETLLEEVFVNLLDNALKYIRKGVSTSRISIRGEQRGSIVLYEVEDNGVGIQPQHQTQLFEMFTRFHASHKKGLGLGLSIVQRIITRLNGEIGVDSTPEEGSTFWFILPSLEVVSSGTGEHVTERL